jgi:hypothetical protein
LTFDVKQKHYVSQNLLAWSLHEQCYVRNPGFLRYIEHEGLGFRPLDQFNKIELDERHSLYRDLADRVWSPARLGVEAGSVGA